MRYGFIVILEVTRAVYGQLKQQLNGTRRIVTSTTPSESALYLVVHSYVCEYVGGIASKTKLLSSFQK